MTPKYHSFILYVETPDGEKARAGAQIKYIDRDLQELARWATMDFEKAYPGYNVLAAIYIYGDYTLDELDKVDPHFTGEKLAIWHLDEAARIIAEIQAEQEAQP